MNRIPPPVKLTSTCRLRSSGNRRRWKLSTLNSPREIDAVGSATRSSRDAASSGRNSGAKSDPSDAGLLVDLLVRHREKLRRLNPDTEQTRTLQFLVEARRKFVSDKTRYSNRLTAYLKMYFPQVLDWFSEVRDQCAAIRMGDEHRLLGGFEGI